MITISNCPDTGLERKITAKDLYKLESCRQVILKCHISHFKNGQVVENARIKSYTRDLVASNSLVRPDTGVLLTPEELDDIEGLDFTPIEEYEFFMFVIGSQKIILDQVERQFITLRDQQNKFDI